MKKHVWICWLALILFSTFGFSTSVCAKPNSFALTCLQDSKMKIKKEELPETARKTLEGDAFKGWSIVTVYKTKDGEYEVNLKKNDTAQTIKFDKEGKVKA